MYFSSAAEHDAITDNEARFYAAFIIVGNVLIAICYHGFVTYCTQIGIRIRLTCTAMIYKKVEPVVCVVKNADTITHF